LRYTRARGANNPYKLAADSKIEEVGIDPRVDPDLFVFEMVRSRRDGNRLQFVSGKRRYMDQPPEWFWSVIERSKPSLKRLAEWLEAAPKEEVIKFAFFFELAAEKVADFSSGGSNEADFSLCDRCLGNCATIWP
jgi:hypothetical protein